MVPAPAHMLQEILSLQQPYMGIRSRVVSISSSLVCKAEVFKNIQLHDGVDVSTRGHQ